MRDPLTASPDADRVARDLGVTSFVDFADDAHHGVAVSFALRPRGRALRVHMGRGIDTAASRLGAAMEAIETAAAEPARPFPPGERRTVEALECGFGSFRFADLGPIIGVPVKRTDVLDVVETVDLSDGRRVFLPAELIYAPAPEGDASRYFGWSTIGLAAGSSLEEATLHAIFEILEHDAVAVGEVAHCECAVDRSSLSATAAAALGRVTSDETSVRVMSIANVFDLACFSVAIVDRADGVLDVGHALDVDRDRALVRSAEEAAQVQRCRLLARDGRGTVADALRERSVAAAEAREAHGPGGPSPIDRRAPVRFEDVPDRLANAGDDPLSWVVAHLARCGFPSVLRHRFALDADGVCAVRVVIPGCEGGGHRRRIGPRLLRAILGTGAPGQL